MAGNALTESTHGIMQKTDREVSNTLQYSIQNFCFKFCYYELELCTHYDDWKIVRIAQSEAFVVRKTTLR